MWIEYKVFWVCINDVVGVYWCENGDIAAQIFDPEFYDYGLLEAVEDAKKWIDDHSY